MLLSNDEFNTEDLDYSDMFSSFKRDGVRAEITNEGIKNRSLKILRNTKVQAYFKEICDRIPEDVILEAEIYSPSLPCREIAGICNSSDKDVPDDLKLYIFGIYDEQATFRERISMLEKMDEILVGDKYEIVEQNKILDYQQALDFYETAIDLGYEGAVLMDGSKKYKEGRVTIKQHIGFKLKPHKETDLEILGVTERLLNTNESQTNELGQSYKRNTVDAKESTGIAACFICKIRETKDGDELSPEDKQYGCITSKVTITGNEAFRREIWDNQDKYNGAYAVIKSMDYGEKNKLRHPRLKGVKLQVEK